MSRILIIWQIGACPRSPPWLPAGEILFPEVSASKVQGPGSNACLQDHHAKLSNNIVGPLVLLLMSEPGHCGGGIVASPSDPGGWMRLFHLGGIRSRRQSCSQIPKGSWDLSVNDPIKSTIHTYHFSMSLSNAIMVTQNSCLMLDDKVYLRDWIGSALQVLLGINFWSGQESPSSGLF